MSCPTCNANQNSTLENVHCETCGAVNCPTPSPCPEIIPTDCVIYTGDGKNCKEDPIYETGDSLSEVQAKIVDYFCEKVHTESTKKSNLPIPNTTVYNAEDDVNTALEKIVDWASTLINAVPSGVNLVSKSHAEMKTLQASSVGFQPGQWYLINDFRTIYEQPNYIGNSDTPANGIIIKEGPVQPIVVFAIAKDKLAPVAFQPDFPQDLIYYNLDYVTPKSSTPTRGRITYRKDERGNECSWDFRNVKFLRYPDVNGEFLSVFNTSNGSAQEFTVFNNSYQNCYNNKIMFDTSVTGIDNITNGFDLPNIVIFGGLRDSSINGVLRNVTLKSTNGSSNIVGKFKWINVLAKATDYIKTLTIENALNFSIIANFIENNEFNNYNEDITITSATYILNNRINYLTTSTFNVITLRDTIIEYGLNNSINAPSGEFNKNSFKYFKDNTITNSITDNNFFTFQDNIISGIFTNNKGEYCSGNTFLSAYKNDFGPHFNDNIVGINFGSYPNSTFPGNRILGPFSLNHIGDNFRGNVLYDQFNSMTVGNNFTLNHIHTGLAALNLSSATHVYGDYNCKVYKNAGGSVKLSYYDAFDAEQTVLITN